MKKNLLYCIIAIISLGVACKQNDKSKTQKDKKATIIKKALLKRTKKPKKNDTTMEVISLNPENDALVFNTKKQKLKIIRALMSQEVLAQSGMADNVIDELELYMLVAFAINEDTYKTVFGESWLKTLETPYKSN